MSALVPNSHLDRNGASEASIIVLAPSIPSSKCKATGSPPPWPQLHPLAAWQSTNSQAQGVLANVNGEAAGEPIKSDASAEPGNTRLALDPCLQMVNPLPSNSGYAALELLPPHSSQFNKPATSDNIHVVPSHNPFNPPSPSPLPPSPPQLPLAISESFDWIHFALWRLMISLPKGSHLQMTVEDIRKDLDEFKIWFDRFRAYQCAQYSLL